MRDCKSLTGTARYASLSAHVGNEQSRRDDLEAVGMMLIYFLKGKLPWMGLQPNDEKDKSTQIKEMKMELSLDDLCKDLPE